jgi:putative transposase
VVDFVNAWRRRAGLPLKLFLTALGIGRERYRDWCRRYGKVNAHNGLIPRDHQVLDCERDKIIAFCEANSLEGYRRLTYMMIDADIVYVSPSTTYRVLLAAGLIRAKNTRPSKKGKGFKQPGSPHRQWHIDITYIKIKGVFHYLILVLDGYSRFIVGWGLRQQMTEQDVEIVVQQAHEAFPEAKPRLISDNGSQFISREFKHFLSLVDMTHTTTSPYYPQSNGKLERCNKTIKEYLNSHYLADFEDGQRLAADIVAYYNSERLHSAVGYVTPTDKLAGRERAIFQQREHKLQTAREARRNRRLSDRADPPIPPSTPEHNASVHEQPS